MWNVQGSAVPTNNLRQPTHIPVEKLVHPSELSEWQRYVQARRLHRETSRSSNRDWYRSALDLGCQLHLFVEGDAITDSWLAVRKERKDKKDKKGRKEFVLEWMPVPPPELVPEPDDGEEAEQKTKGAQEEKPEDSLAEYFSEIQEHLKKAKAKSLGVVLHLADEFATSELAPMHEHPEDFEELRTSLISDPEKVLQDHSTSADETSYRLYPYPGNEALNMLGSAISISRRHQHFLRRFREVGEDAKFPVRTIALSAPLVVLNGLPRMLPEKPEKPLCLAMTYSSFSVLAFFKAGGELVMLRTVRHHFGGVPRTVANTIQTMAVALELGDLSVFIMPQSRTQGASGVSEFPGLARSEQLDWRQLPDVNTDLPFEFQAATWTRSSEGGEATGLEATKTFTSLAEKKWGLQDFLPPTQAEEEMYPSVVEMQALRYGGFGLKIGAAALVLLLAWTGLRAFSILRDSAWHINDSHALNSTNEVLDGKIRQFEGWNALLTDRSKAWVTMELLNRLFPNHRSVVLLNADYTCRPENIPKQTALGMVNEWKVKGYANDEALGHLNELNTRDGIKAVFDRIHAATGAEPLRTDLASRNLLVNLVASENKRYDPEKGNTAAFQFPYQFDLTITQRIAQDDPLAIPTAAVE